MNSWMVEMIDTYNYSHLFIYLLVDCLMCRWLVGVRLVTNAEPCQCLRAHPLHESVINLYWNNTSVTTKLLLLTEFPAHYDMFRPTWPSSCNKQCI